MTSETGSPKAVIELRSPSGDELSEWDDLVGRLDGGDTVQKSGWAELRSAAGFDARYLLPRSGDRMVGGAQVLVRRVPLVGTVGYISNGPLLDEAQAERGAALQSVCDRLVDLARSDFAVLLIQPPDGRDDVSNELLLRGFRPSEAGIAPARTLRLAIDRPEDEIRAGFSRRLRRWTGQWERRGVTVRSATDDDLSTVARLLGETARFHGFESFPESYLRTMYRIFAARGEVRILLGEVAGEPVVCEVLTGCAGVVRSRLVGTDRSTEWEHLNVSGAVQWDAIRWARHAGYRWFDFGGIGAESARRLAAGPPISTEGLPGPDQFKIRFGGRLHTYPQAVEWFRSPALRAAYDLGRRSERGRRVLGTIRNHLRHTAI